MLCPYCRRLRGVFGGSQRHRVSGSEVVGATVREANHSVALWLESRPPLRCPGFSPIEMSSFKRQAGCGLVIARAALRVPVGSAGEKTVKTVGRGRRFRRGRPVETGR